MCGRWGAWAASKILVGLVITALGGCVYYQKGPPTVHFEEFSAKPPKGDTVTVCHAYGCKEQTPFTFSQEDIEDLDLLMASVRRQDSPAEERRAIAYAIGWMERRVAPTVGTARDRPGMQYLGSGVKGQQDCVDEATNTTSYLLVLQRNGLIKHHAVERPFAKDSLSKWTHWAALIREEPSGIQFAIDSSGSPNGENPTVQVASSFYVPDSGEYVPPERGLSVVNTPAGRDDRLLSLLGRGP
jgi:hypothetical protein